MYVHMFANARQSWRQREWRLAVGYDRPDVFSLPLERGWSEAIIILHTHTFIQDVRRFERAGYAIRSVQHASIGLASRRTGTRMLFMRPGTECQPALVSINTNLTSSETRQERSEGLKDHPVSFRLGSDHTYRS
jgi:hypothetical protein